MRRLGNGRLMAVSACIGAALVAAACSSGQKTASAPPTSGGSKATGAPLVVGFVNDDTGGFGVPALSQAAKSAESYINHNGGISGRPLKLDMCSTDGTTTTSAKCANQFVADKVLAVLEGVDAGIDAAQPIYTKAGLHIFGVIATQGVGAEPNNTFLQPPTSTSFGLGGVAFQRMGAKKVTYILPNVGPVIQQSYKLFAEANAKLGIESTLTLVAPANPDITAAVTAARAAHSDAIFYSGTENDCTNGVRTMRQLGWPGKIYVPGCTQFVQALGAQAEGVYTGGGLLPYSARASAVKWNPELGGEFDTLVKMLKASGDEKILNDGYTVYGAGTVMTFVDLLKGISGAITQDSVNAAMASFKGNAWFGGPVDCTAKLVPNQAGCGRDAMLLQVEAGGVTTLVGGKPIDLAGSN